MTPVFVAIEGIDGSGGTTQTRLLAERLCKKSKAGCLSTREPLAMETAIRQMIDMDPRPPPEIMALAFMGDRAAHYYTRIKPAMESGQHVVADRYTMSTAAYQLSEPYMRGAMGIAARILNDSFPPPTVTILLELGAEEARARMHDRELDGYEKKLEFQEHVRMAYLAEVKHELSIWPQRKIYVVDAARHRLEVHEEIYALVAAELDVPS